MLRLNSLHDSYDDPGPNCVASRSPLFKNNPEEYMRTYNWGDWKFAEVRGGKYGRPKESGVGALVSFGIKSFMRPGALLRLLDSIKRWHPDIPILVVDDSMNLKKREKVHSRRVRWCRRCRRRPPLLHCRTRCCSCVTGAA